MLRFLVYEYHTRILGNNGHAVFKYTKIKPSVQNVQLSEKKEEYQVDSKEEQIKTAFQVWCGHKWRENSSPALLMDMRQIQQFKSNLQKLLSDVPPYPLPKQLFDEDTGVGIQQEFFVSCILQNLTEFDTKSTPNSTP